MTTDPIADNLTRMRNALRNQTVRVRVRNSRETRGLLDVLCREGFITGYQEVESKTKRKFKELEVSLKYGASGEPVIRAIDRVSKPGCRLYSPVGGLKPIVNGMGIRILHTSRGVLSDREARNQNVGGEVICTVY